MLLTVHAAKNREALVQKIVQKIPSNSINEWLPENQWITGAEMESRSMQTLRMMVGGQWKMCTLYLAELTSAKMSGNSKTTTLKDSWKVDIKARNQVDLTGDIVQKKISCFSRDQHDH